LGKSRSQKREFVEDRRGQGRESDNRPQKYEEGVTKRLATKKAKTRIAEQDQPQDVWARQMGKS
jgi:hypothetical protein